MSVKETLMQPVAGLAVAVSALGGIGFGAFEPAWSLISSTASLWFPALATTGATILPEFGYADLGTKILLFAALVFVGVQVDKLIAKVQKWIENR